MGIGDWRFVICHLPFAICHLSFVICHFLFAILDILDCELRRTTSDLGFQMANDK